MKNLNFWLLNSLVLFAVMITSCSINEPTYTQKSPNYNSTQPQYHSQGGYTQKPAQAQPIQTYTPSTSVAYNPNNSNNQSAKYDATSQSYGRTDRRKLNKLYESANVNSSILPTGSRSRTRRPMTPRYITIHSTQNRSQGADAWRHSAALRNGALGRKGWHFTTDDTRAVQHLPLNEQGNHAENYRGGPGNAYSIGIEMCEDAGNNIPRTIDRTAKLTAYLMHKHNLPLSSVKPHYHWPRRGVKVPNKNCPHFLLDNGRPGRKWQNYLNLVNGYYKKALSGSNLALNN